MRGRPYIGSLTRSPMGGATGPPLSPAGGATGPPGGPTGLSPLGWATGGLSPVGGATGPLFFFLQRLRCKFEEKKLHFNPVAPRRATGVYF